MFSTSDNSIVKASIQHSGARPLISPGIVVGFASAIVVWVTWFITHIPWVQLPAPAQTGIVLAAWFGAAIWGGKSVGKKRGLPVGAISGFVCALIGLLLIGSKFAEPGKDGVPNVAVIFAGFLGLGVVLGSIGGWLGGLLKPNQLQEPDWLARFGVVVVLIAAPLLFVGGLVTTTNSGMAVPDWPATFETNMFLYPLGTAPTDIFLEHSHRLFGTFLGVGTLLLMIWTLRSDRSKGVKMWAVGLFLAVCLQGLLGGIRVIKGDAAAIENHGWYSVFHGVGAQLIFSGLVALAAFLSPMYQRAVYPVDSTQGTLPNGKPSQGTNPNSATEKRLKRFATGALHTTYLQLVFGAMYRHTKSMHALWTHAGFSIFVVVFTVLWSMLSRKRPENPEQLPAGVLVAKQTLSKVGFIQIVVVSFQFVLGWVIFGLGTHELSTSSVGYALLRTSHQANGALLLAITTFAVVFARRIAVGRSQ